MTIHPHHPMWNLNAGSEMIQLQLMAGLHHMTKWSLSFWASDWHSEASGLFNSKISITVYLPTLLTVAIHFPNTSN